MNGPATDADVIVVGAGHNGLVTAAYLARAGLDVLLLEARSTVGGTAASEDFAGATVNICNCDHLTFRTTPVFDELGLGDHGLRYVDLDPVQHNLTWTGDGHGVVGYTAHRSVEETLDEIGRVSPGDVAGYRRYAEAAMPAVATVFEAAAEPPTLRGLSRLALRRRLAGLRTLFGWSRRSAADVLRAHVSHEAIRATAAVTGPMVWGISPEFDGSGLGALTHAMRHVGTLGRPVGGSGALTEAIRSAFEAAGGRLRTGVRVTEIRCSGGRVAGVALDDGSFVSAATVVSACNPHDTFLRWLTNPPADAQRLIDRWTSVPHANGYESKLDVVLSAPARFRDSDRSVGPTTIVAPDLATIHDGHALMGRGRVLDRPALMINSPTVVDPTMAPEGRHVLSIEVLYTPYGLEGGWADTDEPRRWLELAAELFEPGLLESIVDWRAMTPDRYESEFHLPAGHATSFAGGPLAALRNPHPELTRYETAVDGL